MTTTRAGMAPLAAASSAPPPPIDRLSARGVLKPLAPAPRRRRVVLPSQRASGASSAPEWEATADEAFGAGAGGFLEVEGGARLEGTARVSGAKNAVLALLAGTLACREPVILHSVPLLAVGSLADIAGHVIGCQLTQ